MAANKVNIDLQKERAKCNFNTEELTNLLDWGVKYTERRRNLEQKVLSVKGLLDDTPEEYLSHKEKYENAIRKSVLFYKTLQLLDDDMSVDERTRSNFRNLIASAVFKDNSPFMLHTSMFIPTIMGQCTDEQKAYWLKRAKNMEIIGTYAQTELGHGTFIRGLETRATYNPDTEEFVLHSPALSSYKWWPGGLAHTANYCVVMARLYIKGKSHGIQPFMVQIRDEETHMPLPGIKLGEIGAKLGFNTVNNGFLGFENHRIPRDRMLMKNAQVSKDGTFVAGSNSKLTYGTMVFVRVMIVNNMANLLAKAVTIAVRYSAIRRQSQPKPNEPEPQILDYVTQQHKLFIAIASSHAFSINAMWLWEIYHSVTTQLAGGNLENLPELHALACCLKPLSTIDATAMIEKCRLACGGHGYMLSANLAQTYGLATAAYTYEGENTVLLLQAARSLVKAWSAYVKGQALKGTMAYLAGDPTVKSWDGSVDGIIQSFKVVAIRKISSVVKILEEYEKSGLSPEDAWNKASVLLTAASEAHGRAILLSVYKSEMDKRAAALSSPLRTVLLQLVDLYVTYWALEKVGDMLLYTPITERDVVELQRRYTDLLAVIRPNAVSLVDAFDFRDEILNSTLGAYDGRAYERLMEEAMKSPLNAEPVNHTFHKYLKPFMRGKL
ncbi:PREDICTED: probable peroxisomal acyl-coenzyme A oxidase 1 [Papilio polytes]|uniref:probable peroxisomal acyl-coenzyme A oxidase 1 n=1 Tax=Papilio polytes TaxID=76194 RepID=UPI0006767243|nr:PREDICTED: probable peroxisomal acyl-coenzyme A oxidase 1 [Papilio polytes]XP_013149593.1 PREDICTED: probable peroxisomal acyl-coenzyme A oxidase 1 [Papilio polytes]XP_013149594.1 PREDICTED: probable peroxisomal acyl-coenzyme A oxidase 1 [Papilio polytes]